MSVDSMKLFTTITTYCGLLVAGGATKRDIATLVLGILSAIASGVPFPLIGIVFGQLLNDFNQATCEQDDAIPASYQDSVNQKILLIFYLAIAQFVLIYCHLCCWSLGGARLAQRLREQYLRSLLKQEPLYFSKFPPGEVSARLNGDIQTIRSGTSEKVGIVLASLSFFVTAYIVAFIKDYKLSAELLSLVPAFLLMSFVGSHYVEKYAGIMSDASASAASIALEALSNMVLVQSFRANARLEKRFAQALEIAEAQGIRKAFATGVQAGVLYFVAYSANALAFWQGSVRIASSINEPGTDANVGSVFTVVFVLIEGTSWS
jgi:ABC-type multidrug transport system fused ATPase/permease subunit